MLTTTVCADSLNELYNISFLRCMISGVSSAVNDFCARARTPRTICSNEIIGGLAVHNSHSIFRPVHLTVSRSRPAQRHQTCGVFSVSLHHGRGIGNHLSMRLKSHHALLHSDICRATERTSSVTGSRGATRNPSSTAF